MRFRSNWPLLAVSLLFLISAAQAGNGALVVDQGGGCTLTQGTCGAMDEIGTTKNYVKWTQEWFQVGCGSDCAQKMTDHENFTSSTCGAQGNALQTFGVAIDVGLSTTSNVTICSGFFTGNAVTLTVNCPAGTACYPRFYYPSSEQVYQVVANIGVGSTIVSSSSFVNSGTITTCTSPCAYDSGSYVEAKVGYVAPSAVTFYVQAKAQGGAGAAPGAGGAPPPLNLISTTSTRAANSPNQSVPTSSLSGMVTVAVVVVVVLAVYLHRRDTDETHLGVNKQGKTRSPNRPRKGTD